MLQRSHPTGTLKLKTIYQPPRIQQSRQVCNQCWKPKQEEVTIFAYQTLLPTGGYESLETAEKIAKVKTLPCKCTGADKKQV